MPHCARGGLDAAAEAFLAAARNFEACELEHAAAVFNLGLVHADRGRSDDAGVLLDR